MEWTLSSEHNGVVPLVNWTQFIVLISELVIEANACLWSGS